MLKKLSIIALVTLAATVIAFAQTDTLDGNILSVYQLNYYANSNNPAGADQFVRIVNPGVQGTPLSPGHGTICADIYVFDATQEMLECCSCPVTANGILDLSLSRHLVQNPLTGFPGPNSGVIKIVSDSRTNCNEMAPYPTPMLLAWGTHVQQPVAGTYVTTEDQFINAWLTREELAFLGQACSFVQYLGSGKGVCKCGSTK
jgi:hypothetical protein